MSNGCHHILTLSRIKTPSQLFGVVKVPTDTPSTSPEPLSLPQYFTVLTCLITPASKTAIASRVSCLDANGIVPGDPAGAGRGADPVDGRDPWVAGGADVAGLRS